MPGQLAAASTIARRDWNWSGSDEVTLPLPPGNTTYTRQFNFANLPENLFETGFRKQCGKRWPLVRVDFGNLNRAYRANVKFGDSAEFPIPAGGVFTSPPFLGIDGFELKVRKVDGSAFEVGENFQLTLMVNDQVR